MAKVKVTYWREVPVSVMVRGAAPDDRASVQLPKIYMVTVDAIATRSGQTDSKSYTAGFRYDSFDRDGSAAEIAAAVATELQEKYPKAWLQAQWRTAGIKVEEDARLEREATG